MFGKYEKKRKERNTHQGTKVYVTDVPAYLLAVDVEALVRRAVGGSGVISVGCVARNVGDFLCKTWWGQGEGVGVLVGAVLDDSSR